MKSTGNKGETMTKKIDTMPTVQRTSAGLRDAIFDELDALRNGVSNPTRANAVAKLAGSVVETVRMEIDAQKFANTLKPASAHDSGIKTLMRSR
jgi:hypothetical protein